MAVGKKKKKRSELSLCFCHNMTVPINMVRPIFIEEEIVDVLELLHLLRWIFFYLRSFYSTVRPDEGHGL